MYTWAHRISENLWDQVWVQDRTPVTQTALWALKHQELEPTWIAFLVVRANTS